VSFSVLPPRGKERLSGFVVLPPAKRLACPDPGRTSWPEPRRRLQRDERRRGARRNDRRLARQAAARGCGGRRTHRSASPSAITGGRLPGRAARLREISRSRHRASHQRPGARTRHSLRSALPAGGSIEAPLSRRRVPDDLRAQRLDQPCQLIFLCLYSQCVT